MGGGLIGSQDCAPLSSLERGVKNLKTKTMVAWQGVLEGHLKSATWEMTAQGKGKIPVKWFLTNNDNSIPRKSTSSLIPKLTLSLFPLSQIFCLKNGKNVQDDPFHPIRTTRLDVEHGGHAVYPHDSAPDF